MDGFSLEFMDYCFFGLYFVGLCIIGYWFGRKEKKASEDYFLAGRSLPWWVVGTSFIASNISSEHFIGTIGAAFVYGICVAQWDWGNIAAFSILIFLFVPFLLATRVFTIPEFLERRYNNFLRQFFAFVTVLTNVVAFLAAVLYSGAIALENLFGWNFWASVIFLAVVAGSWAIYGGLSSVAWTDFYTTVIMLTGGAVVTYLGVCSISDSGSFMEGWHQMLAANHAQSGIYAEAVRATAENIVGRPEYDRMAIIQPASHGILPWPSLLFGFLAISIWYNVINQFMIQRVLGARNQYHARMGIVLAGFIKVFMPFIIVIPGMVLFTKHPEILLLPWDDIRPEADKGYIYMLHTVVPLGLRGLFLAALFGAIQSTINSVLNSTATIITLDFYKRVFRRHASERELIRVGVVSSVLVLLVAILMSGLIERLGGGLFVYVNTLYAFFAPPFSAIFILGIMFRRINASSASITVVFGFLFGIAMKAYVEVAADPLALVVPFGNQAIFNWLACTFLCVLLSLFTAPPAPHQVSDELMINWKKLNFMQGMGGTWYKSVLFWWLVFAATVFSLILTFSGYL